MMAVKSKFTCVRCYQITWQVLEETRMFFDQRLGTNDLKNKGPWIFPTANLGGFIEDVCCNKFLDYITMPSQWNTQDNGNKWSTHNGKGQGTSGQSNLEFLVPF